MSRRFAGTGKVVSTRIAELCAFGVFMPAFWTVHFFVAPRIKIGMKKMPSENEIKNR